MSKRTRFLFYAAALLLPPLAVGTLRGIRYFSQYEPSPNAAPVAETQLPAVPAYDPRKPTVAVLLGADITEITDALGPYEIFSRTGRYNVYMVAPERQPSLLSGGLRIIPHLSLAELDRRTGGRTAIVVVPNIPNVKRPENAPSLAWLRVQAAAGALIHSWCDGALAVAEAGLLDGRRATAHWGDIAKLERAYPRGTWVRGVRWVEDEALVMSAGINSGIDASLRIIARRDGDSVARRVAAELRYPNYRFVEDPSVTQLEIRAADAILLANAAFRASRRSIGVALYDGVGELGISNVYDAYAASGAAEVHAVVAAPGVVRTRFGVTLLPSLIATRDARAIRGLDRLVTSDGTVPPNVSSAIADIAPGLTIAPLDTDPARYPLETVLEDLARTADLPSARFAQKRLEYRSPTVELEGRAIPWDVIYLPFAVAAIGAGFAWLVIRLPSRMRRVAAVALTVGVAPNVARAQSVDSLAASTRIRLDVRAGERTLFGRARTQSLTGSLGAIRGDTILLVVTSSAEPLRVPRSAIRDVHASRGVPNRFEAAVRRAVLPTLASAAFTAVSLNVRRRDGDASPSRGALAAAGSTAAISGALGFLHPQERWQKIRVR
jgi:putative intracellular protease/amidase